MHQNAAVFLLIALSLLAANAPFLLDRPLLLVPWARQGQAQGVCPAWVRWGAAVALPAALAGVAWGAQIWIGQAVSGSGVQTLWLLVLAVIAAAVLLLAAPGRVLGKAAAKPFWQRLCELLVLYALVGSLGFALEANQGGVFSQGWEFYAVTFSLFLVMAYPGFVACYLYKHNKHAGKRRTDDGTAIVTSVTRVTRVTNDSPR